MYYRNLDCRWYKCALVWTVAHHANFRFELNKYRVKMIKKKPLKSTSKSNINRIHRVQEYKSCSFIIIFVLC